MTNIVNFPRRQRRHDLDILMLERELRAAILLAEERPTKANVEAREILRKQYLDTFAKAYPPGAA